MQGGSAVMQMALMDSMLSGATAGENPADPRVVAMNQLRQAESWTGDAKHDYPPPLPPIPAAALEHKGLGNKAFSAGDFPAAVTHYSRAMEATSDDYQTQLMTYLHGGFKSVLHSNRAASLGSLKEFRKAATDALIATSYDPTNIKAFYRLGIYSLELNNYKDALSACVNGLLLDDKNAPLLKLQGKIRRRLPQCKEDDTYLLAHCMNSRWPEAINACARTTEEAVAELFVVHGPECLTPMMVAILKRAPVEVFVSMLILSRIDPEKRNILNMSPNPDYYMLPLHAAAVNHLDPEIIKLFICGFPEALLLCANGSLLPKHLAHEHGDSANRVDNPAVPSLLIAATDAFSQTDHPRMIELCGTDAAWNHFFVPASWSLLVLCQNKLWDDVADRIAGLSAREASGELYEKDEKGRTAFATAVADGATLELLQSMIELDRETTADRYKTIVHVELDRETTVDRNKTIVHVKTHAGDYPFYLAAIHRAEPAVIKLMTREHPGCLDGALELAIMYKRSTDIVSLLRKCCTAWENGNIAALIDLCGESARLLFMKKYAKKFPVHHVVQHANSTAILKPVFREHASELLAEDDFGYTPIENATNNKHSAVVSFVTEVDAAFHNCDYPALIKLCGSTPDWKKKAQHYKDKKKKADTAKADALEESFFEWDEEEIKKKQPEKKKKKKKPKKKKEEKKELSLEEQMAAVDAQLAMIREGREAAVEKEEESPELSLEEQMAALDAELATMREPGVSVTPAPVEEESESVEIVLGRVYMKLFGGSPLPRMKMTTVLAACEDEVCLPGEGSREERVAALKLIVGID